MFTSSLNSSDAATMDHDSTREDPSEAAITQSEVALRAMLQRMSPERIAAIRSAVMSSDNVLISSVVMSIVTGEIRHDNARGLGNSPTAVTYRFVEPLKQVTQALVNASVDSTGDFSIVTMRELLVDWLAKGAVKHEGAEDLNSIGALIATDLPPMDALTVRERLVMALVPAVSMIIHVLRSPNLVPESRTLH